MKFCVITHVPHIEMDNQYFGYAPYIKEMNIWLKFVDELTVVAPLSNQELTPIHENYQCQSLCFTEVEEFNLADLPNIIKALIRLPKIYNRVYRAMKTSDHIHLRCPGNLGLLGCIAQIFFPSKTKTAKYAGNWDSKAKQPFTYKLQRWILSNTFLTKNMQVLVYGEWPNQSRNIKSFFTASYKETEKLPVPKRNLHEKIRFVFVGTLSAGKQPMYTLELVKNLYKKEYDICLDLFGEGLERKSLEHYILENNLSEIITLHGNQKEETVRNAYQNAHFLVLPSKSEGWPKAVAEAMFWGCVPISCPVSCVPDMLDYGNRGILLSMDEDKDIAEICNLVNNEKEYFSKSSKAENWSRKYTLDVFEAEIKKILHS